MPTQYQSRTAAGGAVLSLRRAALAFGLVPLLPAFYAAVFFAQPWALPYGLLLAYPSALLPGVPLLWLLVRRRWLRWWQFGAAGLVCALPAIALYRWQAQPAHFEPFSALNALYLAAWGAFAGLIFWLLGVSGGAPVSLRVLFGIDLGQMNETADRAGGDGPRA